MLCLSLHWLLIYLYPIVGNPRCRRLEAKASRQFGQSGFITLDRTTNVPAKMSHLKKEKENPHTASHSWGEPTLEVSVVTEFGHRSSVANNSTLKADITKDRRDWEK